MAAGLPNPLERTLLTTGMLCLVHQSRARGGLELSTPPGLAEVAYTATPRNVWRPRGERPKGGSVGPMDYCPPRPVAGESAPAVVQPITRNGTTRGPQRLTVRVVGGF